MRLTAILQQMQATSFTHMRRRPLRHVLVLIAIAVAVALFVSMRITQASLLETFQANLRAMAGGAEYSITANTPIPAEVLDRVERIPGVRAAPLIESGCVLTQFRRSVHVLGIDLPRDSRLRHYTPEHVAHLDLAAALVVRNALVVPSPLADQLGLKLRDAVTLGGGRGPEQFTIVGILTPEGPAAAFEGNLVFMPLATAQRFFDRIDTFDRIDLAIDPPATPAAVTAALAGRCELEPAGGRDSTFQNLFLQFQTILTCITIFAAAIGLFIVYNTASLSVVERARQIGILRALGARRAEVLTVITLESVLVGLLAAALGLIGGRLMATSALVHAARSLTMMIELGALRTVVPVDTLWLAPLAGILAAGAGAVVPALKAAGIAPVAAMKPGAAQRSSQDHAVHWLIAALPLLGASLALVAHQGIPLAGSIAGVAGAVLGVAFSGPQLVQWIGYPARAIGRRCLRVPSFLALDNLIKYPTRTSLTTVAFAGSLALIVAMSGTVKSLQDDVSRWLDTVFVFDLTVSNSDLTQSAYSAGTLPRDLLSEAQRLPQAAETYGVRARRLPFRDDRIMLIAYDLAAFDRTRASRGLPSGEHTGRGPVAPLQAGKIAISDNFARIHHVAVGDRIALPTPDGPRDFEVAGIEHDLTWFRGTVFMDLAVYEKVWHDPTLTFVDIRLRPDVDRAGIRDQLEDQWSTKFGVFLFSNDDLKSNARRYLTEWFALANVQLLLAVLIGGVGVANTMLISVLTQSRQIALLRAIGASTAQVRRMLLVEAGYLGILFGIAGCLAGLAAIRVIVVPLALKASGFILTLVPPYPTMASACVAAVAIALISAILPMRAARRIDIVQGIGYE